MNSKLSLPKDASLADLQVYVDEMCKERGFDQESLQDAFVLLTEEVGELARIVRKSSGIKTDVLSKKYDAPGELADLLIYLLHIANILDINLEQAFRDKEEINKKRNWS